MRIKTSRHRKGDRTAPEVSGQAVRIKTSRHREGDRTAVRIKTSRHRKGDRTDVRIIKMNPVEKFGGKYRSESHRMPNWNYGGNGIYFITIVVQNHICYLGKIEHKKMIHSQFGKIAEEEWHRSFELRNELFLHAYVIMPNHIHALIGLKHPIDREINEIHTAGAHDMDHARDMDGGHGDHVDTHGRAYQNNDNSSTHGRAYQSEPPPHEQTHGRAYKNRETEGDSETDDDVYHNQDSHVRANRHATGPRATTDAHAGRHSKERKFIRKPKSISSFIAGFKSAVVTRIDDYIDENQLNIRKFNRRNKFWQDNYHDRIIKTDAEYWNVKRYIVRNPQDWNEDDYFKP